MKKFWIVTAIILAAALQARAATLTVNGKNAGDVSEISITLSTPTATPRATATVAGATPAPTARPTVSPTAAPAPTPTMVVGVCPAPVPALYNPQNPVAYGADKTGVVNSSSAFSKALSAGDLDVAPGTYSLLTSIFVPSGRNIRCPYGTTFVNKSQASYVMFYFNGTMGGGVFGCRFVGYNATANPMVWGSSGQSFIFHQSIGNGGTTGGLTIANDDFDGIAGYTGAVQIFGNSANQPPPKGDKVICNTFERCAVYSVQLTSGSGSLIAHNKSQDCSGFVEADNMNQVNSGNLITDNQVMFSRGTGYAQVKGQSQFTNFLTCGSSASGYAFNYSGNNCTQNLCGGTASAAIRQNAVGGTSYQAHYSGNTATGGCRVIY